MVKGGGRPELLTVELPQSLEKQDEEIQAGSHELGALARSARCS